MANEQDKKPVDIEALTEQLEQLSEEELKSVAGGRSSGFRRIVGKIWAAMGGEGGSCGSGGPSVSSGVRG